MTEKIKEIIDRYPWVLMVAPIVVVAIVAFFFLSGKNNASNPNSVPTAGPPNSASTSVSNSNSQASNASSNSQTSGFNPFVFILRLLGFEKDNAPSQTATGTSTTGGTNSSQTTNSTGSTTGSNTSTTTGGSTQDTSNGGSTNTQSSDGGSTPSTPIEIIFKTPDGGTEIYTPPATPPVDVTWGRYTNPDDRYSIDYPTNWQVVKTAYNGHEGVSLYLPGTNPSDPNVQYIGFGLATYYLLPGQNSQQNTYSYPITVGSTNGTMDTQGVLGNGSMAAVFSYEQGSFGLGSNVSDPDFIYVYNHMLQSLTFGPQ
jgi:hypothetical protein